MIKYSLSNFTLFDKSICVNEGNFDGITVSNSL